MKIILGGFTRLTDENKEKNAGERTYLLDVDLLPYQVLAGNPILYIRALTSACFKIHIKGGEVTTKGDHVT